MAKLVSRLNGIEKIAGSNPAGSTTRGYSLIGRARHSHCQDVGSTPTSSTKIKEERKVEKDYSSKISISED